MKLQLLKNLENAIQDITHDFAEKHFGKDVDMYWIADDIGGVLFINDYFFSLTDIMDFIKCGYTTKQMFAYYDYSLNEHSKGITPINIANWRKLKS